MFRKSIRNIGNGGEDKVRGKRLRSVALGMLCMTALCVPHYARAEIPAPPAACKDLQAKYPQFKGKTLVNAVNPHTPGYEALDPKDPSNLSASTSISARSSAAVSASP